MVAVSRRSESDGRARLRRELVEAELYEQAARLFAERGFGATTLQDVAGTLEISRPALYHYVSSKEDLLRKIVAGFAAGGEDVVLAVAARRDLDPIEQLREMTRRLCVEVATSPNRFRLLIGNEASLPAELLERQQTAKRVVTDSITDVIRAGVRKGLFRLVDARVAALAIIGMCNWLAWWYRPSAAHPPESVAEQIAEQAVRSVLPDSDERPHGGSALALARQVRERASALERLLKAERDNA